MCVSTLLHQPVGLSCLVLECRLFYTKVNVWTEQYSNLQKEKKKKKERNQPPLGFAIQISADFAIQNFVPKIVLLITGD